MFSVLLPIYFQDDPQLLSIAIHSIWNDQTVKPGEVVLVLDGPIPDYLQSEVTKWAYVIGDKLKIIPIEKNVGLGAALNIGLKNCSFELVARMDADDVSLPYRFERQLSAFEQSPEVDIVGGAAIEIDESGNDIGFREMPVSHEDIISAIWAAPVIHPSVMYRRDAILGIGGYDDNLTRRQDYELWFRCAKIGLQFRNVYEPVVKYRFTRSTHAKQPVKLAFKQAMIGYRGSRDLNLEFWKRVACFYPFFRSLLPIGLQVFLNRIVSFLDPRKRNQRK